MVTKKLSRFFGLISERSPAERPAHEQSIAEHPAFEPVPIQPQVSQPQTNPPPQAAQADAAGTLLHALQLTSHADESLLTEQEKRQAWELPPRPAVLNQALVPRSTLKARLLAPALEQMRQTQSTLMSGYAPVAEPDVVAGNVPGALWAARSPEAPDAGMNQRHAARPNWPAQHAQQAAAQAPTQVSAQQDSKHRPLPAQSPAATSAGWEYSLMLQHAEGASPQPAPESSATPATQSAASGISLMFQRLRSHAQKPPAPTPTPPDAVAEAPGFLNKLWAK